MSSGIVSADSSIASQKSMVRESLNSWITDAEEHVVALAEAMPEEKYSFAPTAGEFHGVRTFAEQLKHLAANNYAVSARITGQKAPVEEADESGPASVKTKSEILNYVKGSFTALHKAADQITDENAAEALPDVKADIVKTRIALTIDAVAHSFDHYGQLVEYLRMNGIIPPASR